MNGWRNESKSLQPEHECQMKRWDNWGWREFYVVFSWCQILSQSESWWKLNEHCIVLVYLTVYLKKIEYPYVLRCPSQIFVPPGPAQSLALSQLSENTGSIELNWTEFSDVALRLNLSHPHLCLFLSLLFLSFFLFLFFPLFQDFWVLRTTSVVIKGFQQKITFIYLWFKWTLQREMVWLVL